MKLTDVKCKYCNKSIGKLNTDGKPIFKTLKEGVVEYNGLFCSEECFKGFEELNIKRERKCTKVCWIIKRRKKIDGNI